MTDVLLSVSCACGPLAVPELDFIADESIMRRIYCHRCRAILGVIEIPQPYDEGPMLSPAEHDKVCDPAYNTSILGDRHV